MVWLLEERFVSYNTLLSANTFRVTTYYEFKTSSFNHQYSICIKASKRSKKIVT